jgi:hypothetical protein
MNYNIPSNILKLIESYVDEAKKQVNNRRPSVAPTDLTELFTNNPEIKFFKVISKQKGVEQEHNFGIEVIVNTKTNKPTGQATIKDLKSNCQDMRNLSTLLYGNTFGVDFGGCGMTKIDNAVMIKTYVDLNGQPDDEYPIDFEEDVPTDQRIQGYYNSLKALRLGEYAHFDQAGTVNKYDGEVIRNTGTAMQLTMTKHGSKAEFNLNIDLEQNPFYLDNDQIMFKGEATTPKEYDDANDSQDRKEFNIQIKSFTTTNQPPKTKKDKKPEAEKPDDEKPDDEELKSDGKKAMDAILNNPLLKQAFYKQPSLWNLFKAELQGKKAPGTGILPTIQLVGDYEKKKYSEKLGADFIEGKEVKYRFGQKTSIPYVNKNGEQTSLAIDKDKNYVGRVATHELGVDGVMINWYGGGKVIVYSLLVKKSTGIADTYFCDLIKMDETTERKENKEEVQVRFFKNEDSNYGYKPKLKKQETK